MKYTHNCPCGAEIQFSTDKKITDKQLFICFKCKAKFYFRDPNDEKTMGIKTNLS